MGEIAVVVIEAQRQALEDGGRQSRRVDAPLLAGIAAEKRVIELRADHAQRLLLEIGWMFDFLRFAGDEGAGFIGPHDRAEELVDGQKIDRQRIDRPAGDGLTRWL